MKEQSVGQQLWQNVAERRVNLSATAAKKSLGGSLQSTFKTKKSNNGIFLH